MAVAAISTRQNTPRRLPHDFPACLGEIFQNTIWGACTLAVVISSFGVWTQFVRHHHHHHHHLLENTGGHRSQVIQIKSSIKK